MEGVQGEVGEKSFQLKGNRFLNPAATASPSARGWRGFIPTDLFTPIFAISRAAGWTAQVLEQLDDNRLYRPLTLYTGPHGLKVTPIDERA
jgi:hypothetical protein